MKENQSPCSIFQIGLGVLCILIGISGFILSANSLLSLKSLFLGIGVLLFGLANNNTDKSEKEKTLSYGASFFMIFGAILIFYTTFFDSK